MEELSEKFKTGDKMKKYILDTFQIPLNEEESKKYFFKSIKEMNMLERKIYLKNERKYLKFLKILFRRNKKFILKIKNFYDYLKYKKKY